jgi:hypothetical protein
MKRLVLVAIVALALPAGALAKGPSAAEITGPGIGTIRIAGDAESNAVSTFSEVTAGAGFFAAVYRPQPDPMLRRRPQVELGPRYRIAWTLPTPTGRASLYQDVYPYAKPYAVTYMRPGQTFYGGMTTHGGWYVGGAGLKQSLVAAGLPRQVPSPGSGLSAAGLGGISAGAFAALALAVFLVTRLRRRASS